MAANIRHVPVTMLPILRSPAPAAVPNTIEIVAGPMSRRHCAVRRRQMMFFQKIANAGWPRVASLSDFFALDAVSAPSERLRNDSSRRDRSADASIAASSNAVSVFNTHNACTASTPSANGIARIQSPTDVANVGATTRWNGRSPIDAGALDKTPLNTLKKSPMSPADISSARCDEAGDDEHRDGHEERDRPPRAWRRPAVLAPRGAHERRAEAVEIEGGEQNPDAHGAHRRGQRRPTALQDEHPDERIDEHRDLRAIQLVADQRAS